MKLPARIWHRCVAVAVAAMLLGGCDSISERKPSRYVLVFVDGTASVRADDEALYRQSIESLVEGLGADDLLEIGAITAETLTAYNPVYNERVPKAPNDLLQKRANAEFSKKVFEKLDGMARTAKWTHILDAVTVAGQRFAADSGSGRERRQLVILSDMQENSSELKMSSKGMTAKEIESFIAKRKEQGRLPSLSGVEVFVGGASAPTAEAFDASKRFWMAYFAATGANIPEGHYQRAPLRFQ